MEKQSPLHSPHWPYRLTPLVALCPAEKIAEYLRHLVKAGSWQSSRPGSLHGLKESWAVVFGGADNLRSLGLFQNLSGATNVIVMPVREHKQPHCTADVNVESFQIFQRRRPASSWIQAGIHNHPVPMAQMHHDGLAHARPEDRDLQFVRRGWYRELTHVKGKRSCNSAARCLTSAIAALRQPGIRTNRS